MDQNDGPRKECEFTTGRPKIPFLKHISMQPGFGDLWHCVLTFGCAGPRNLWCVYSPIYLMYIPLCLYVYTYIIYLYLLTPPKCPEFLSHLSVHLYNYIRIISHYLIIYHVLMIKHASSRQRHRQNHQSWWSPRYRTSGFAEAQPWWNQPIQFVDLQNPPKLADFGFWKSLVDTSGNSLGSKFGPSIHQIRAQMPVLGETVCTQLATCFRCTATYHETHPDKNMSSRTPSKQDTERGYCHHSIPAIAQSFRKKMDFSPRLKDTSQL